MDRYYQQTCRQAVEKRKADVKEEGKSELEAGHLKPLWRR
jgi:hypothetical protein